MEIPWETSDYEYLFLTAPEILGAKVDQIYVNLLNGGNANVKHQEFVYKYNEYGDAHSEVWRNPIPGQPVDEMPPQNIRGYLTPLVTETAFYSVLIYSNSDQLVPSVIFYRSPNNATDARPSYLPVVEYRPGDFAVFQLSTGKRLW